MNCNLTAEDFDLKSKSIYELKVLYQNSENRYELSELKTWTERGKLQKMIEAELKSREKPI